MHIEAFRGEPSPITGQSWYWHFVNKGRITANGEAFPTKANAIRAAKAVVRGVCKRVLLGYKLGRAAHPEFTTIARDGVTRIEWA